MCDSDDIDSSRRKHNIYFFFFFHSFPYSPSHHTSYFISAQVRFGTRDGHYWTRYRKGKKIILEPACSAVKGFSWNHLAPLTRPEYYQVRVDLPKGSELKVRYSPLSNGPVCGHVRPGQVLEVWAVFGVWLQIQYGEVQCAWVLRAIHTTDVTTTEGAAGGNTGVQSEIVDKMILARKEKEQYLEDQYKALHKVKRPAHPPVPAPTALSHPSTYIPNFLNIAPEVHLGPLGGSTNGKTSLTFPPTLPLTRTMSRGRSGSPAKSQKMMSAGEHRNVSFLPPTGGTITGMTVELSVVDLEGVAASSFFPSPSSEGASSNRRGKKENKNEKERKVDSSTKSARSRSAPALPPTVEEEDDKETEEEDDKDGVVLIRKLHPSVQVRMSVLVTKSPFDARPEDLKVDKKWKRPSLHEDDY